MKNISSQAMDGVLLNEHRGAWPPPHPHPQCSSNEEADEDTSCSQVPAGWAGGSDQEAGSGAY